MVANSEKEHLSMAICGGNSLQHGDEDESTATDVHMDICERLTAVEAALRLQLAAGTSHLQEIEMAPGAFGLSASARPAIKAIRKRRNAALHVVGPGQDFDAERAKDTHRAEKLVSELDGKTLHEVSATGKEKLKSYGGGGGRGGLFQCPIQVTPGTVGHLLLDVTCPYDQDEPGGHVIRLKHLTSVLDRH